MIRITDGNLETMEIVDVHLEKNWKRLWGPLDREVTDTARQWLEQFKRTVATIVDLERKREALRVCMYLTGKGVEIREVETQIMQEKHREPVATWGLLMKEGEKAPSREDMS